MDFRIAMFCLLSTTCFLIRGVHGATKSDLDSLITELFTSRAYSVDVRPVNDFSTSTHVYMSLILQSIVEVNEADQTLKTNTLLFMDWSDEYLSWTPSDYGDITSLLMRQKQLWMPDIVVGNSITSHKQLGYDNLKLRIGSTGLVEWSPSEIIETSCDIDITYYPFDTQVCNIIFKSATSHKIEIEVFIDKTYPIDVSDYSANGLWDLLNTSAENFGDESEYGDVKTRIMYKIQRRRSYYMLNVMLPILFLSLTSSLTFALPSDSGEKIGLAITVLLAYAVYLTIVTSEMPETSLQVSLLTIYLVTLLALTASSVVLSVIVLSFYHRHPSRPVRRCICFIFLLRKLLLLGPIPAEEEIVDEKSSKVDEIELTISEKRKSILHTLQRNSINPDGKQSPSDISDTGSLRMLPRAKSLSGPTVANTLDRFIFIIFTSIILAVTMIFIIVLTSGANRQERDTSLQN